MQIYDFKAASGLVLEFVYNSNLGDFYKYCTKINVTVMIYFIFRLCIREITLINVKYLSFWNSSLKVYFEQRFSRISCQI